MRFGAALVFARALRRLVRRGLDGRARVQGIGDGVRRGRFVVGLLVGTLWAAGLTGCPDRGTSRAPQVIEEQGSRREEPPKLPAAPEGVAPKEPAPEDATSDEQPADLSADSPWHSYAACLRYLQRRGSAVPEIDGPTTDEGSHRPQQQGARIGTWNVRWYPDGRPGKKAAQPGTDIGWMACAIATLDVDVLALQEIKTLPRAERSTAELLTELGRLAGGTWRAAFDDCPQTATQHVGFLWNETRVRMTDLRTVPELNPHGQPCKDSLRPGFAGLAHFADGTRVHVVSVHFKSGGERRSLDLRNISLEALGRVAASVRAKDPTAQVVFAGDFNTMGCARCSPKVAAEEELRRATGRVARDGLRWVSNDPPCTEYYRDRAHLLDGFVVTTGLAERLRAPARSSGLCGEWSCRAISGARRVDAFRRLSDHCPVVLELLGD